MIKFVYGECHYCDRNITTVPDVITFCNIDCSENWQKGVSNNTKVKLDQTGRSFNGFSRNKATDLPASNSHCISKTKLFIFFD